MQVIDHAVLAVRDLDAAAERLHREHGFASAAGGRHQGWGTGNRIVPLGEQYVELLGIVDEAVAAASPFGRFVADLVSGGDRWFTFVVRDDKLDATAARLGLEITPGSRLRPDGAEIRWRAAGFDDPAREWWHPFFIDWEVPADLHPGRTVVEHSVRPTGIAWVQVAGDEERLRAWLGGDHLPIRVVDGDPQGVLAVGIRTADGAELVLG